ncbi:hypothetical protein BV898_09885 [Hypsibius exemplaris]|uniref:Protein N-terminal glutamine amidohydrolase n=1 Tax=Hypsibius exemplaris TaxID=2072580 RepID=A0A1W0WL86_HYPEX|nr:hypothetical protein BV898_09885 [Hypsibius exemplaris]
MDISRSECIYTACYCEENIWKLCKKVCDFSDAALIESCWVIFLSNSERCVPIFKQMKAPRPDHPVF